jgi:hypothetical protein
MTHTHQELCSIAVRWLKRPVSSNGHACHIAIPEPRSRNGESPDAIGFRSGYAHDRYTGTIVVECKTSRSDFLADHKKPWREAGKGMGRYRYYMCPEGLIKPHELPPKWGLVEVNHRGHCKVIVGAITSKAVAAQFEHVERDSESDQHLLVDWLSRIDDAEKLVLEMRGLRSEITRLITQKERLSERLSHCDNRLDQSIDACLCGKARQCSEAYIRKMHDKNRQHVFGKHSCQFCHATPNGGRANEPCRGAIVVTADEMRGGT